MDYKKHFLHIGEIFTTAEPYQVITLLGSCVSTVIYNPRLRVGSLNHFMLPGRADDKGEPNRYGDFAITNQIREVLELGGTRGELEAKVYGGGTVLCFASEPKGPSFGQLNIDKAIDILEVEGVKVTTKDVGGVYGRKLIFNTYDGSVKISPVKRTFNKCCPNYNDELGRCVSEKQ